ncbi:hypothetical protein APHAL10511_003451 [Amanita phalloides]|nr:hypothetical protein APHAL10511_003451 [Amanita phalloides]
MIKRVLQLKQAVTDMINDSEFSLDTYELTEEDWQTLEDYNEILQVPHAFQHILGTEKTPTLPYIIPAFSAFSERWKEFAEENVHWASIIQPGLDKLAEYEEELGKTPAYVLAMAIDPSCKFAYLPEDEVHLAKRTLLKALRAYQSQTRAVEVAQQQPATRSSRQTAASILFPKKQHSAPKSQTLDIEVDEYLGSPSQETGILEFWQVPKFIISFDLPDFES